MVQLRLGAVYIYTLSLSGIQVHQVQLHFIKFVIECALSPEERKHESHVCDDVECGSRRTRVEHRWIVGHYIHAPTKPDKHSHKRRNQSNALHFLSTSFFSSLLTDTHICQSWNNLKITLEFPGLRLEIAPQWPNVYLPVSGSIGVESFFTKRQGWSGPSHWI